MLAIVTRVVKELVQLHQPRPARLIAGRLDAKLGTQKKSYPGLYIPNLRASHVLNKCMNEQVCVGGKHSIKTFHAEKFMHGSWKGVLLPLHAAPCPLCMMQFSVSFSWFPSCPCVVNDENQENTLLCMQKAVSVGCFCRCNGGAAGGGLHHCCHIKPCSLGSEPSWPA